MCSEGLTIGSLRRFFTCFFFSHFPRRKEIHALTAEVENKCGRYWTVYGSFSLVSHSRYIEIGIYPCAGYTWYLHTFGFSCTEPDIRTSIVAWFFSRKKNDMKKKRPRPRRRERGPQLETQWAFSAYRTADWTACEIKLHCPINHRCLWTKGIAARFIHPDQLSLLVRVRFLPHSFNIQRKYFLSCFYHLKFKRIIIFVNLTRFLNIKVTWNEQSYFIFLTLIIL